jgi:hypothetical protein
VNDSLIGGISGASHRSAASQKHRFAGRKLAGRSLHTREVAGSSPAVPITKAPQICGVFLLPGRPSDPRLVHGNSELRLPRTIAATARSRIARFDGRIRRLLTRASARLEARGRPSATRADRMALAIHVGEACDPRGRHAQTRASTKPRPAGEWAACTGSQRLGESVPSCARRAIEPARGE